jgi:hypothetical protein
MLKQLTFNIDSGLGGSHSVKITKIKNGLAHLTITSNAADWSEYKPVVPLRTLLDEHENCLSRCKKYLLDYWGEWFVDHCLGGTQKIFAKEIRSLELLKNFIVSQETEGK